MVKNNIKKYSLEITLLISTVITVISFMLMASQGYIQSNQLFVNNIEKYSKFDTYMVQLIESANYNDVIYTETTLKQYIRVTKPNLVKSFDGLVFRGNTVVIGRGSYPLDFKITMPKIYIDLGLTTKGVGYGIVLFNTYYIIGNGYSGQGTGVLIVYFEYSNGKLTREFKYGKLTLPTIGKTVYIVYIPNEGVFKGYSNPSMLKGLFTSDGKIIDPNTGEPLMINGGA